MSEYQNIIDREQNAIIKQAQNMTNREMLLILIQHGHILGHPYILTRDELIDRVVDAMASELSL